MRVLLGALAVVALPALAGGPFQYKGVSLGVTEAALRAVHPEFSCGPSYTGGDRSCVIRGGTYAGVPAKGTTAHFVGGKLYSVSVLVPFEHFPAVKDALTEAYGAPSSTQDFALATTERPDRGDSRKRHFVYQWTRGLERVRADSYAESHAQAGELSSVVIETDAYKDELKKVEAERKKKRTKDL